MQNDLISRKALIKHLVDWRLQEAPYGICDEETETYKTICGCIEAVKEQPTAYDVEKVVAELEKISGMACNGRECLKCVYSKDCYAGEMAEVLANDIAIEIVRNGGKE